jgi:isopentenyl-diphosphate delta-isomerase
MSDKPVKDISSRKDEHIELAQKSILKTSSNDDRFNYEPLLSSHPSEGSNLSTEFLGKKVRAPLWISSMTGGSVNANRVNKQLAEICAEFGLGMGLGSCRPLMESKKFFDDFNLRPYIGDKLPLLANIGVAQLETIICNKSISDNFFEQLSLLKVDGIFVHINPLQEFLQPEGDRFSVSPLESINKFITISPVDVLVKEVGQGLGPKSLSSLSELDIKGIEFGAYGGTNFSRLELLRSNARQSLAPLSYVGHTAEEMIKHINNLEGFKDKEIILSGGIENFLDAHYLLLKSNHKSMYGMAGKILRELSRGENYLKQFIKHELSGLNFAKSYLTLKDTNR